MDAETFPHSVFSSANLDDNVPIVLYLHSGLDGRPSSTKAIEQLCRGADADIVDVRYEVSDKDIYPHPIHSVLAGYDWVNANLCGPSPAYGRGSNATGIGVCGELIGGGLATMLALTECHRQGGVAAAAVSNPIVDWSALDLPPGLTNQTRKGARRSAPEAEEKESDIQKTPDGVLLRNQLLAMRKSCFSKPEKYFDPFASPLLFFRTPRFAVPGTLMHPDESHDEGYESAEEGASTTLVKKRLSYRAYPPLGSDLRLPRFCIEVGEDSPLKDQGLELVHLMERSLVKSKDVEVEGTERPKRFGGLTRKGSGSWDEADFFRIGQWFHHIFQHI